MKIIEDSLRDFWDNIKCTNIRIIGVPEEEEKKKGTEKIFEELQLKTSKIWERKESIKSRKHRVPYNINPWRNTPGHILIKLLKITYNEKILTAARGKTTNNIQGNPHKVNS